MRTNLSLKDPKKVDPCVSITARSLKPTPQLRWSPRLEEARVLHDISVKAREDRRETKATRFARKALAILERDHADDREIAKVLISLAAAYLDSGDHSRAEASYRRAAGLLQAMGEAGGCLETQRLRIDAARGLSGVAYALGRYGEAEAMLTDAIGTA